MTYTYTHTNNNTIGINSKQSFIDALNNESVLSHQSFASIFKTAERLIKTENSSVSDNAISNVRGTWYEWLLAVGAIEFYRANPQSHYLLPLPNIRQYDCAKLYQEKIFFLMCQQKSIQLATQII